MPQWALHLLGSPRLERDGSRVEIHRRKVMALLIYLAVTGRSHSRDSLAALLWPEYDQVRSRAAFRHALSELQKTLGKKRILVAQDSICLEQDADFRLDIIEFHNYLAAYRAHGHHPNDPCPDCLEALTQAVLLYKDGFLTGFTLRDSLEFDEWQILQAETLHRELIGALKRLVLGFTANGEIDTAITYTHRWLALDPLDEVAYRQLMQLYTWSGKRNEALRQYQNCVRILKRELGVAPQEETTALYDHIRTSTDFHPSEGITPVLPAKSPRLTAPQRKPNNLPVQLTSFIGRTAELHAVMQEISRPDVHLLTLIGPGGVGKTRLSIEVAAQLLDLFEDGTFFVNLAPLRDPALVAATIARVLGVPESKNIPLLESLKKFVYDRNLLLVLDNFEHLINAAPLVTELLNASPHLKVLVTSRTLLHVYGEHLHPVRPLILPSQAGETQLESIAQSEAVQLFIERTRAMRANFTLTSDNFRSVSEICARLDGLPLAIELAAARVRAISPQVMLSQWAEAGGQTRLQTLADGQRDQPARHQTLRNAIAWSYQLLDEAEKKVFRRAGVLVGDWTLEAAENVIGPSMLDRDTERMPFSQSPPFARNLNSLVDNHLLESFELDGEMRFSMLETIREYALEQLTACEELESLCESHARYYLAFTEHARQYLFGPQQALWVNRLALEYDNLRAALKWAVDNQKAEIALRFGGALGKFWYFYDPIYWSEGRQWLERALNIPASEAIPLAVQAKALNEAGVLAWAQVDYGQAIHYFEECLTINKKLGDKAGIGSTLGNLGMVAREQLDLSRARTYQEECLALKRELGDKQGIATALSNLGLVVADQGDWAYATTLSQESISLNRELQNKSGLTLTLHNYGGLLAENLGDFNQAKTLLEESLALSRELGKNFFLIPYTLIHLGSLALYQNEYEQARGYFEQGLSLSQESNNKEGVGYALHKLGSLSYLEGDDRKANEFFVNSLQVLREVDSWMGMIWNYISMAGLACRCRQPVRAVTLLGASENLCAMTSITLLSAKFEEYQRNLKAARSQLDEADFNRIRAEGRAMSLDQILAYVAGNALD